MSQSSESEVRKTIVADSTVETTDDSDLTSDFFGSEFDMWVNSKCSATLLFINFAQ